MNERTAQSDRCEHCGTIRITFDPPIELTESAEIFLDEVWAVFRQAWTPQSKTQDYIDSLFYTEASARAEMVRQIEQASQGQARTGAYLDTQADTWRFDDDHETISIGKVSVRL